MSDETPDDQSPAEQRLVQLLEVLTGSQAAADPEFASRVVRHARAQRAVATPLRVVGGFLAAMAEGVRMLVGFTRTDPRR